MSLVNSKRLIINRLFKDSNNNPTKKQHTKHNNHRNQSIWSTQQSLYTVQVQTNRWSTIASQSQQPEKDHYNLQHIHLQTQIDLNAEKYFNFFSQMQNVGYHAIRKPQLHRGVKRDLLNQLLQLQRQQLKSKQMINKCTFVKNSLSDKINKASIGSNQLHASQFSRAQQQQSKNTAKRSIKSNKYNIKNRERDDKIQSKINNNNAVIQNSSSNLQCRKSIIDRQALIGHIFSSVDIQQACAYGNTKNINSIYTKKTVHDPKNRLITRPYHKQQYRLQNQQGITRNLSMPLHYKVKNNPHNNNVGIKLQRQQRALVQQKQKHKHINNQLNSQISQIGQQYYDMQNTNGSTNQFLSMHFRSSDLYRCRPAAASLIDRENHNHNNNMRLIKNNSCRQLFDSNKQNKQIINIRQPQYNHNHSTMPYLLQFNKSRKSSNRNIVNTDRSRILPNKLSVAQNNGMKSRGAQSLDHIMAPLASEYIQGYKQNCIQKQEDRMNIIMQGQQNKHNQSRPLIRKMEKSEDKLQQIRIQLHDIYSNRTNGADLNDDDNKNRPYLKINSNLMNIQPKNRRNISSNNNNISMQSSDESLDAQIVACSGYNNKQHHYPHLHH